MRALDPQLWRNADFRRFFGGQFVTNAGDSLYTVAVLWLAFELSGSTALTGALNSILLLPWLLQVLAGPLVDRLPLRPVLVGSQVIQGTTVLVLPVAAVTGRLSVSLLFAVVPVLMLATLAMAPMETALLPRIVADGRLSAANAALATVTLGLDMVFDALGGAIVARFGTTSLFLLDAGTFGVAAILFAGITIRASGAGVDNVEDADDRDSGEDVDAGSDVNAVENLENVENVENGEHGDDENPPTVKSVLRSYVTDLRAGVETLRGTVFVELLVTTGVANFATGVTLAILPAFASGFGGAAVYGLLLGALGVGRLVGSLLGPYLEGIPYGAVLTTQGLGACCWLGSVFAPSATATVVLFGLAWVPAGASGVLTSTLNQRLFPTEVLGRVSATKGTASGATLPLGSLVGGLVAELLGTTTTMALAAAGFAFTAVYVLARPRLRELPAVSDAEPSDFGLPPSP